MHITQVNYVFDPGITDPDALLDRYTTLTGWSGALLAAGASRVSVVQRFSRDAAIVRNGVHYAFLADGAGGSPRPWSRATRIHRAAAETGAALVHVQGLAHPFQLAALRRALAGTPVVVQDHASGEPAAALARGLSAKRAIWRRGLRGADAFFFTSRAQAVSWQHAGLIAPSQQVHEVLESSTAFEARPRAAARRGSGVRGSPAVLWVGRLNDNKDPLTVLDGFERSLDALPDARLTMVFAGGDRSGDVRMRVDGSWRLSDRVRLTGEVPHAAMADYFSAADLFVLGSHHEGSGYALLEACACGAVPVVTDIPSFRTITDGGAVGALWRVGDAGDLCRALVDVGQRDSAALSDRVREHFSRALSWRAVGEQAMRAYREVIGTRAGRAIA